MTKTMEEILDGWAENKLSYLIFTETKDSLMEFYHSDVKKDLIELTRKNAALGGSDHGYLFDNEVFASEGNLSIADISPIDASLEEEASFIKKLREDIRQDYTYIANFLGALQTICAANPERTDEALGCNTPMLISNIPPELPEFSNILRQVMRIKGLSSEQKEELKFDREDKEYDIFYLHYDRIIPPLKKYLFKRITG